MTPKLRPVTRADIVRELLKLTGELLVVAGVTALLLVLLPHLAPWLRYGVLLTILGYLVFGVVRTRLQASEERSSRRP